MERVSLREKIKSKPFSTVDALRYALREQRAKWAETPEQKQERLAAYQALHDRLTHLFDNLPDSIEITHDYAQMWDFIKLPNGDGTQVELAASRYPNPYLVQSYALYWLDENGSRRQVNGLDYAILVEPGKAEVQHVRQREPAEPRYTKWKRDLSAQAALHLVETLGFEEN